MPEPGADSARATARDGWIWGYPVLENYRTLYAQAVDDADPRSVGGFGRFLHHARHDTRSRPRTPAAPDGVTADHGTPLSWAWLDLRAEPWVVSVPATDRRYVLTVHDLDTPYVGFIGSRTTGRAAGDYLVAGPGWTGGVPSRLTGALFADTLLVGIVGRAYPAGPDDVDGPRAVREGWRLTPLSRFLDRPAPHPAPEPVWPVWREEDLGSVEFFTLLDFLLQFCPVPAGGSPLRERLAALGVTGGGEFEPAALTSELTAAIEQGIADARALLKEAEASTTHRFGTRQEQGDDFLTRAVGAAKGLYRLPAAEARYAGRSPDDPGDDAHAGTE
ncbi:DUF1254 domain-containing protein [Streptomyces sp. NPDC058001]|uniref:DUF1254 domain-containing protein n=1 Tax=Streptomyces sp. NPDC058001 TaxID=3346300 RepID=UPI0036E0E6F3